MEGEGKMSEGRAPTAIVNASPSALNECLTDQVTRKLIHDFLKKQTGKVPQFVETYSGTMFKLADSSVFYKNGELTVEMGPFRHKEALAWKKDLQHLLVRGAALLFQQKVKEFLAERYEVSGEQRSETGVYLCAVRLWEKDERATDIRVAVLVDGRIAVFCEDESPEAAKAVSAFLAGLRKEGVIA